MFGGAAIVVPQSLADIAHPGGGDAGDTASADHLIKEDIGNRPDQRKIAASLADDFMSGGEGNQRLQRKPQRNAAAIGHVPRNCVAHAEELIAHLVAFFLRRCLFALILRYAAPRHWRMSIDERAGQLMSGHPLLQ